MIDKERSLQSQKVERLHQALTDALKNEDIKVYYQPKIEAGSTRVIGAEALVRWEKKDGAYMYPNDFIPELEKSGRVIELDYFVYRKVFQKLRERLDAGKPVVPVSLNVSRAHLKNLAIYDYVKELFKKYKIPPHYIEFELTESMYVDNFETFRPMIDEFRAAGGKISMDDFGSGYSSLNLLTDLPIDTLKVDKVFLRHDTLLENEKIILACVIAMAKKLKMDVICEGVETKSQSQFLSRMGCDMFQGYLYSKPIPEEAFYDYLEEHLDTDIQEIHFSFDGHLYDDTGEYQGIMHGNNVKYDKGPTDGMSALHFYGGEPFHDCIELPVDILKNDSYTINMWIKEEEARLWSGVYYAGYANGFCDIMPKGWDMSLTFRIKDKEDPTGWCDAGDEIVGLNQWIMITACYDSVNHISTVYLNGSRCGILENVLNLVGPKVIFIGGDIYAKGFCGCLADLRIFDQPLSFEQVRELYKKVKNTIKEENKTGRENSFREFHFTLNETLTDTSGKYQCFYNGDKPEYGEGPDSSLKALYFKGGAVRENVLMLPEELYDLESFTISYWIKDENPREWVNTFYLEAENGFMSQIPYGPSGTSIFRMKDFREEEWRDTLRERMIEKNQWHQIVLVYNAEIHMISHYVDGKHNGIKDGCYSIGKIKNLIFGGDIYQNSFEGYISDIRIFNQAFSIQQLNKIIK